ncbi:MAG: prepilin-type N-terminal cleavage/methylation domain-containing protein [Planctomycetota bacterium]
MRSAFTLVELLLVLALLVVGASVASVALSAGEERARLRDAAETLSRAWSEARLQAIEAGEPLVFRCRIGDSWGYVGTSSIPEEPAAVAEPAGNAAVVPSQRDLRLAASGSEQNTIIFRQLLVAERAGAPAVGAGVREGDLSAMVIFYPDGATSDAEATLSTVGGMNLRVTLRGLTGATRVTDPLDDTAGPT